MSIFNGNSLFLSKKSKTMPVVKVPKNVKQSLQIDRAFENGIFKIEPKEKMAVAIFHGEPFLFFPYFDFTLMNVYMNTGIK